MFIKWFPSVWFTSHLGKGVIEVLVSLVHKGMPWYYGLEMT